MGKNYVFPIDFIVTKAAGTVLRIIPSKWDKEAEYVEGKASTVLSSLKFLENAEIRHVNTPPKMERYFYLRGVDYFPPLGVIVSGVLLLM